MSLSFDDAVETLASMFGEWDRETLSLVLQSHNYRLESAIEFILASGASSTPAGPPDANSSGLSVHHSSAPSRSVTACW